MGEINVQEAIQVLPDERIVSVLLESEVLRKAVADLLIEIYAREDITDQREKLRCQTVIFEVLHDGCGPSGEGDFSILDAEGNDGSIRTIARIRQAVSRAWRNIGNVCRPRTDLITILKDTRDGDLAMSYAHRYRDDICVEGKEAFDWIEENNPVFSPEFQVDIVRLLQEDEGKGLDEFSILMSCYRRRQLSNPAYRALLTGPITRFIVRLILHDDEIDPEILEVIKNDPKYDLIYRARSDAKAQEELCNRGSEYDLDMSGFLAALPGLASEEVAREIVRTGGINVFWLRRNQDVLARMPWLRKLVSNT